MSTLDEATRAWIVAETGSAIRGSDTLEGATTATVHRVDLEDGRRLVVKRFDRRDFLDERPDRAAHEATVLELLAATPVPAPRLVTVDGDGARSGVPIVLMEWVEGATDFPDGWVDAVARNLSAVHAVAPGPITWEYERYNADESLFVPSWAADPAIWTDAFAVAAEPPTTATGFIHRDYHGGNLLWREGEIVAVLDWLSGCVGPLAIDTAHLRTNLAMDHDIEAADAVLDAYGHEAWHPAWDVIDAVDIVPYYHGEQAVEGWEWDDRPAAETRARFDRWLSEAVSRVA
jgi:aminoglycoside phosphotransferase (APT) family kinase protein